MVDTVPQVGAVHGVVVVAGSGERSATPAEGVTGGGSDVECVSGAALNGTD